MTQFDQARATWDQRYAQDSYIFGTDPNQFLVDARPFFNQNDSALVIADGEGRNSVWLASQGLRVCAFDISPIAVEKAERLAKQKNVSPTFHIADCDSWIWKDKSYDVIAAIFIQFADPISRQKLFANMVSNLKPGGVLILQGYTPKQLEYKTGGPPCVENLYTEDLLRDAFRKLEIIRLESYEQVLHEGTQHSGPSALIGLIARKPKEDSLTA
jgi:SAM-dependent methyltransferase